MGELLLLSVLPRKDRSTSCKRSWHQKHSTSCILFAYHPYQTEHVTVLQEKQTVYARPRLRARQSRQNESPVYPTHDITSQGFSRRSQTKDRTGEGIEQLQGPERAERLRQEQERQDAWKAAFEHPSAAEPGARKADDVESRI